MCKDMKESGKKARHTAKEFTIMRTEMCKQILIYNSGCEIIVINN